MDQGTTMDFEVNIKPGGDKKLKRRIAIQGIETSFHERAAFSYFGEDVKIIECLSFQRLCESLQDGAADFAVMAIENSIAGSILPNYALLETFHFRIIGELYLPIHLNLLALPGVKLEEITCIESHPMAIRQCSEFINGLSRVEIRESDDTALSARRVSELKLMQTAAIANESAAKKFGLEILERRIESHRKNFTRFLILSRESEDIVNANKASLSFGIPNHPGSLADALMVLKQNDINLSKIQSTPIIGKPNEYSIHLDVEWDERINYERAITQIVKRVKNLNVLGEYERGRIIFS